MSAEHNDFDGRDLLPRPGPHIEQPRGFAMMNTQAPAPRQLRHEVGPPNRNERCLAGLLEVVIETIDTAASWPWNCSSCRCAHSPGMLLEQLHCML